MPQILPGKVGEFAEVEPGIVGEAEVGLRVGRLYALHDLWQIDAGAIGLLGGQPFNAMLERRNSGE